jgi:RNA polymerase sigma-70 factor (ECF subfamily)
VESAYSSHDAEELTQGFFAQLIEKHYLGDVRQERGRFRSFLLAAMKHFLAKQRDRAKAQKRGGGRRVISLDVAEAETRYALEAPDRLTPERLFDRRWALTLLERVLDRLRGEYRASNRQAQFDRFQPYLTGEGRTLPYRQLAGELGMNEGAIKVAVHRMRKHYRELLREEIAATVSSPEEVEDELNDLFHALSAEENS